MEGSDGDGDIASRNAQLQQLLAELRVALGGIYGSRLQGIVLFGSEARSEAELDSDIDIVVILRGQVDPGREITRLGSILADLNLRYGRLVSVVPTSSIEYESASDPFWRNVRREGVPV